MQIYKFLEIPRTITLHNVAGEGVNKCENPGKIRIRTQNVNIQRVGNKPLRMK